MKKRSPNKKRAFVREYLKDQNGTQAAIRAGYSKKTARSIASENLTKPDIKAALAKKIEKAEEKAIVDLVYVIKGFKEVADRCRQEDTFDAAGANKALECLGKHLGAFIEKHEHSGPNGGPIRLEDLVAGAQKEESEDNWNRTYEKSEK